MTVPPVEPPESGSGQPRDDDGSLWAQRHEARYGAVPAAEPLRRRGATPLAERLSWRGGGALVVLAAIAIGVSVFASGRTPPAIEGGTPADTLSAAPPEAFRWTPPEPGDSTPPRPQRAGRPRGPRGPRPPSAAELARWDAFQAAMESGLMLDDGPRAGGGQVAPGAAAVAALAAVAHQEPPAPPPGPFSLVAGTRIYAALENSVSSQLDGMATGRVTRDVYDSRGQGFLLIPQGAKLIGSYSSTTAAGQDRLLIAWNTLVFPDGRQVELPKLPLTDRAGRVGARDKVDHHTGSALRSAVALGALAATFQLSQPNRGSVFSGPTAGEVAAGAVGQELARAGSRILQRNANRASTITIREGTPFHVFVTQTLDLGQPYRPPEDAGAAHLTAIQPQ